MFPQAGRRGPAIESGQMLVCDPMTERVRLDKWLWAARLYKTRGLAQDAIQHGRVGVNGASAKPSREVHVGDRIVIKATPFMRTIDVLALAEQRGPAPVAQALYAETPDSIAERERMLRERKSMPPPAPGRPTKRDRRELADWQRWSASAPGGEDEK